MDCAWLKEAADAVRVARYRTVLELRRDGLQIEARSAGGYHEAVNGITWDALEAAEVNPLPTLISVANQDLGRKIARRTRQPLRPEVIQEPA